MLASQMKSAGLFCFLHDVTRLVGKQAVSLLILLSARAFYKFAGATLLDFGSLCFVPKQTKAKLWNL